MLRGLPPPDGSTHPFFGHDAIALSFFVACVAATLALVSSMCSACGRKPKPAAAPSDSGKQDISNGGGHTDSPTKAGEEEEVVVTLPPDLGTHGPIAPVVLPSSTSKRRLSMSLSKKMSINIPDKLRLSRRERKEHKVESEDTLWKKGIILGEKCKIPGERDGEGSSSDGGGADPADELVAESFRRSSYSRPVSRSGSVAMRQQQRDDDAPAGASLHS